MVLRPGCSRRRALLVGLVLAGFTLVLELAPAFHHDFLCHLKSPSHCPACLASPVALGQEAAPALGAMTLAEAEPVARSSPRPSELLPLASPKDRSPPA